MVAALECYLDGEAQLASRGSSGIRALWDALESAGIPSLRDLTHGLCLEVLPIPVTFTGAAVADHNRGEYHPLPGPG